MAGRTPGQARATAAAPGPAPAGPSPAGPAGRAAPGARSLALDVFRGATVALMILVNNPGSWDHLYPPLAHAAWHGWTPTDLVFPFFLVAVGLSLALVAPRWQVPAGNAGGDTRAAFWRRWLQRGLGLFAIGLLLNLLSLPRWQDGHLVWRSLADWRLLGVLQRIALAWMAAALLVWLLRARRAPVLGAVAALLLGYFALCQGLGQPSNPYSLEGFFGTALDRAWLGPRHLYQGEGVPFDPEGLASTLPAVAQVLLGWAIGDGLRPVLTGRAGPAERRALLLRLAVWAALALAAAQAWALLMPINKKLWTSPYVLHTTGLAMLLLGLLVLGLSRTAEQRPERRPGGPIGAPTGRLTGRLIGAAMAPPRAATRMAEAYGRNALAVFVLSGLLPRLLALVRWPDGTDAQGVPQRIAVLPWLYRTLFLPLSADPRLGSLLMALCQVLLYWAVAHALNRRGWIWRL